MTDDEAQDAVFALFKAGWDANTPAVNNGDIPELRWENVGSDQWPTKVAPWARIGMAKVSTKQHSLGPIGGRIYVSECYLLVQIYVPRGLTGTGQSRRLADVAMNAVLGRQAGPSGEIWFRDVDIQERGPVVDGWWQTNVRAYFEYQAVA